MDLFEYQAKDLFRGAGIPIMRSELAGNVGDAEQIAGDLGFPLVIKAQVHAGGRGKAGGVRIVRNLDELREGATAIFDLTIKGKPVDALLLEAAAQVLHEFYVAITLDRQAKTPLLIFSRTGGVDIEQLAADHPEALLRVAVDPLAGVGSAQLKPLLEMAKLDDPRLDAQLADLLARLWGLYRDRDATLVEVNPLALISGEDGNRLVALDAKMSVDENALYRQPMLDALRTGEDERERSAERAGVTYLSLEGDIGVAGNGAGLVMSTLDLIGAAGGAAANFCDVGGGARAERIAAALDIVASDSRVRVLLLNIFGGITRGDEAARGVLMWRAAAPGRAGTMPLVVRLDGTAAEEGRDILRAAEIPGLQTTESAAEAVELAVAAARQSAAEAAPLEPVLIVAAGGG
jgi:succinyl-CoA synthetase beta subunit